jgi:hypothetical protein
LLHRDVRRVFRWSSCEIGLRRSATGAAATTEARPLVRAAVRAAPSSCLRFQAFRCRCCVFSVTPARLFNQHAPIRGVRATYGPVAEYLVNLRLLSCIAHLSGWEEQSRCSSE